MYFTLHVCGSPRIWEIWCPWETTAYSGKVGINVQYLYKAKKTLLNYIPEKKQKINYSRNYMKNCIRELRFTA